MFTTDFWRDAGRRALRTVAQSLVGLLTVLVGADLTEPEATVDVLGLPWGQIVLTSLLAGGVSLLQSIGRTRNESKVRAVPAEDVEDTESSRQSGGDESGQ